MHIELKHKPELDPDYVPAVLWNRAYEAQAKADSGSEVVHMALSRPDGTVSLFETLLLPYGDTYKELNNRYIERLFKFLLWQKGASTIHVDNRQVAEYLSKVYSPEGDRSFDYDFMGEKIYATQMTIEFCDQDNMPAAIEASQPLGRHLKGSRIGFDLGGSDRKCAAVVDGKVIYSEEIRWDPYFEKDPQYHIDGIKDSLSRAAEKLETVDAIGGSAAGIYVNNDVRVASLFRGISEGDFNARILPLFHDLQNEWGVPFEVVNDGEVTALAASMSIKTNAILGISMGTSVAAGYVTPRGNITSWLNELAFVPVDYRDNAPLDEWSGDEGCAVQYFCQQGVARLAKKAGLKYPETMPAAEQLVEVQSLMEKGDERAVKIFETIGTCFGYTIAHFAEFYEFRNLLVLGRVMSGKGGAVIIEKAQEVLKDEFLQINATLNIIVPDEEMKRHGQAVAAASLPSIGAK